MNGKIRKITLIIIGIVSALLIGANFNVLKAEEEFERFIKPITNPVYFDEPCNRTYVHILHVYQNLPSHVNTTLGDVPLDGRLTLTAIRLSYAVNERFSIVAAKDGYIDFDPDHTLSDENGWADIAGGVKYAFLRNPQKEFILSGKVLFEFTQGSRDVFQGNGDGNVSPSLTFLKGYKNFQFCGILGGIIPFDDDEESTLIYDSWHVSHGLLNYKLFPLLELNHFRVVRDGESDELVASIAEFEGGDVINLGARHASSHRDFVSMGVGFRYRPFCPGQLFSSLDLGFAYEFPLTTRENGLMKNRFTFDLIYYF